jgi:2-polyprenyl-3-methyl-5-hydroxy-6-metoxy-1,4-benzoquinol methylase
MQPATDLLQHLADYHIHRFRDRRAYERWAEQQLGPRWRQRLIAAYRGIDGRDRSRDDVRRAFDSSSHTKIAQVNLSSLFDQEFALGRTVSGLLQGRKKVLDLGCNIGHLTTWYARTEPDRHVVGVDFSLSCVVAARHMAAKLGLTNVEFEVNDIEALALAGTYDAIVETLCLKYVKDMGEVLNHLAALLLPQGILVSSTLGTMHTIDGNALLRSSGLCSLGQPLGRRILVSRKQAAGAVPDDGAPYPSWCDVAASQVILVGA